MTSTNGRDYDVIVVGGGPAGLAAALGAHEAGCDQVLVIDRERETGGILNQCVHTGFGLHLFKEDLTGPEYAERFLGKVRARGTGLLTDTHVLDIDSTLGVSVLSAEHGPLELKARAVVLAQGCRERTRGALQIPGSRPAGVMTAGLAQKMVNQKGLLPGRRIAILGSGDIGLIMARRLALEHCEVAGVFELLPFPSGLPRNLVQCLDDFDIPLALSTTVSRIHGRDRLEGVTVSRVDEQLRPTGEGERFIPCDTLLLSVGLIPDSELARNLRIRLDPGTGGPVVSSTLETSFPGVFACGNGLHVHDLADFVSEESEIAGRHAGEVALGARRPLDSIALAPGDGVRYTVPQSLAPDRDQIVNLRPKVPVRDCVISVGGLMEYPRKITLPSEMVRIKLPASFLERFHGDSLVISIRKEVGTA